jgi:diguanylate cyclase (GGDEF)-like protein
MLRPERRPRIGLLGKFAVVSLVPIVLLGLALAFVLRDEIRQRALSNARQSATLLEYSLVQPQLEPAEMKTGLSDARIHALDQVLKPSLAGHQIARIKVWNREGRVVYASDHSIIGRTFPPDDHRSDALAGKTASEVSDLKGAENSNDHSFGKLLEVYTPLRFDAAPGPAGAFEIYVPYRPVAAAISSDTNRLYVVLLAGLVLLYLALFRIVARASNRLRRQAEENERLALHDPLTDLPNRTLFHDRAAQAIVAAKRARTGVGLMIFDLDRFKEINDTLGHHNGDLLLKEIGARLRETLRESDTVARLGGDEFGVLLPTIVDDDATLAVAENLRQAIRRPLLLNGITLDLEASAGIALYPAHGEDIETLLQRADVAMYVAKDDHSGSQLYSNERDDYSPARLALVGELRRAIDNEELVLYYQPRADLQTGQITSVEALIRWQHPQRGLLLPIEFIPLAERTGQIRELTHVVLEKALHQLRQWEQDGLALSVAVNLSARDLLDLELPNTVRQLLSQYGVPAERLGLELTESVILADPMRAHAILSRLGAMGIQLAVDDFGVGYSSLAYLKRLPVGEIKIDRSFVMNMEHDENDAVIVRSTIELGRNLGLRVIAEGVESEAIWNELARLECDQAQGFYLSRPIPEPALRQWLRDREIAAQPAGLAAAARVARSVA